MDVVPAYEAPKMIDTIRAATPNDAQAIASVQFASWQVAYRGLLPDDALDELSVAAQQEFWTAILSAALGSSERAPNFYGKSGWTATSSWRQRRPTVELRLRHPI